MRLITLGNRALNQSTLPASARRQDPRWIEALADKLIGHDSHACCANHAGYVVLYLTAPEGGRQLPADSIHAVEQLGVLRDHHERERAAGPQHAPNFPQRPSNILLREQFQKIATHHSVKATIAKG